MSVLGLSSLSTLLALTVPAEPEATGPDVLFVAAARSHPGGGLLGAEALYPFLEVGPLELSVGPALVYAYYWAELTGKIQATVLDGLVIAYLLGGAEPGDYIRVVDRGTEERSEGMRGLVRARLELNLKGSSVWLYNRFTAEGRVRRFAEYDPFRDVTLSDELSIENAVAPIVTVLRLSDDRALWAYVELTVAHEFVDAGLLDLRPSAGLIFENALDGLTINLDLYHSLRDGPIGGTGVLMFVWWTP